MPSLSKALRSFHAIRHLPPGRIGWRFVQRGRRRLGAAFPARSHASLVRRAARLANDGRVERVAALAAEKARQQGATSTRWRLDAPDRPAITIHGVAGTLDATNPVAGPAERARYLWHMSASYLNYLLVDGEAGESPASLLGALADGYSAPAARAVPGVHECQWHPYAASQRLVSLVCLRALHDGTLASAARERLDAAIGLHTRYVLDHREYDLHFNHLFKNLFALVVSALYREGRPSEARMDEFFAVLDYQLHADGGHTELCPMYHALVLGDLVQLQRLPDGALGERHRRMLDERVGRMRAATAATSFANDEIALFGDSWLGEAPPPSVLGAPARARSPDTVTVEWLPDSGYARLAGGAAEAIVDVGPAGPPDNPGHSHDDYLAVELCLAGRTVVADYGVAAYAAGEARDRTRAASSHNGPTFDGARGLDAWGEFRTGRRRGAPRTRRADGPDEWRGIDAVHTPLDEPGVGLRRRLSVHPSDGVAIRDTWSGVAPTRRPRSVFLLTLSPEALEGIGFRLWSPDGFELVEGARVYREFGIPSDALALTLAPATGGADEVHEATLLFVPLGRDPRAVLDALHPSSRP